VSLPVRVGNGGFDKSAPRADAKQWAYETQREQICGDAEYGVVDAQR